MSQPFYITTTLPYVNSDPHIGFAMEIVRADAIARYQRLMGREVFFNTGTDEHGQKVWQKAETEKRDVQEYVDEYATHFGNLKGVLNLSYDNFIRTTNEHHVYAAVEMWNRCLAAGDIYKKKYKGLYCVYDEMFVTERDIHEGRCINHPDKELVIIEEENYFFKFSKFSDALLKYLEQPNVIIPEFRRHEAIAFVKSGLEDFSISRTKEKMSWGIPVPNDESQVMYVWFDALTNYISTLGWPQDSEGNFIKFWEEGYTVQIAGKDQIRFQSLMWQAMLMSAKIKTTDQLLYNGFINSGGQKMSKSLGNVIDPETVVNMYGTDTLRYYLLRHVHPFDDSDVTMEKIHEAYNANLANGLGNVVSRLLTLGEKYLDQAPAIPEKSIPEDWKQAIEEFRFDHACDIVWRLIGELDKEITEKEPYKVLKTHVEEGKEMLSSMLVKLYTIARMLNPLMPETSAKIKELVRTNKKPGEPLFMRK